MQQLSEVKSLVEFGDRIIAAQRRIIAVLSENGHDASGAEKILQSYQVTQEIRLGEVDRLQNTLDQNAGGR